jgi:SAM-dependent methyltransferase
MTYDAFRAAELQGWDAHADVYDDATARATVQSVPDLLAAVRLWPGARLLDVCCGPGYAAGAAAALGADAEGIDFAPAMARAARARFPGVAFAEGDASFDIVVLQLRTFPRHRSRTGGTRGVPRAAAWRPLRLQPMGRARRIDGIPDLLRRDPRPCRYGKADPAPDGFALPDRTRSRAVLFGAGFSDVELREAPGILRAPATGFVDSFMRLSVQIPLILSGRSEEARQAIRDGSTARSGPMRWPVNSTSLCPA